MKLERFGNVHLTRSRVISWPGKLSCKNVMIRQRPKRLKILIRHKIKQSCGKSKFYVIIPLKRNFTISIFFLSNQNSQKGIFFTSTDFGLYVQTKSHVKLLQVRRTSKGKAVRQLHAIIAAFIDEKIWGCFPNHFIASVAGIKLI